MLDEDIQQNTNFMILQARYGKLSRNDQSKDVTQIVQEIVKDQGGQLLLKAGSKEPIFGSVKTKTLQLLIVYSQNSTVYTRIFQDTDPVCLGKQSDIGEWTFIDKN